MSAFYELMLSLAGVRGHNRPMPPGYVTTKQAAERLGIKEQQVRDMIRAGLVAKDDLDQVGRNWLIKESALKGLKPRKVGRPKGVTKR